MKIEKHQLYALRLGIDLLSPVPSMWSQRKKRPIRMERWRKLSRYAERCVRGKSSSKAGAQ